MILYVRNTAVYDSHTLYRHIEEELISQIKSHFECNLSTVVFDSRCTKRETRVESNINFDIMTFLALNRS